MTKKNPEKSYATLRHISSSCALLLDSASFGGCDASGYELSITGYDAEHLFILYLPDGASPKREKIPEGKT